MAKPRQDAAVRRERRAKIAAIVLGAVFLLVCAIQVPRLLKHGKGGADSAAQTAGTTTAASATAAAPTATPAAGALLASAVEPASPIRRFTLFAAKDPFSAPAAATATGSATSTTSSSSAAKPPAATAPASPKQATPTQTMTFVPGAKLQPTGRKGVILGLNGRRHGYVKGDRFPAKQPVFRLAAFTRRSATLRLVSGTFASGSTALKLRAGHRVVIENANSGTRYVLRFVRPALVVPAAATLPTSPAAK
jgi:hypothetical protein